MKDYKASFWVVYLDGISVPLCRNQVNLSQPATAPSLGKKMSLGQTMPRKTNDPSIGRLSQAHSEGCYNKNIYSEFIFIYMNKISNILCVLCTTWGFRIPNDNTIWYDIHQDSRKWTMKWIYLYKDQFTNYAGKIQINHRRHLDLFCTLDGSLDR